MTSAIDELRLLLAGKANLWQIDVEQALGATMERLKDCSADDAVEFAMAGLRTIRAEHSWESHILTRAIGQLLRRKIPFTENQVLEMVQLASVPNKVFPFKGILTAAQSVPLTPSLADALRELRPCITEYLGGGEMRDLQARIDILLNGPAPETALEVQGSWSQAVFQEIAASPQRSVWERVFQHATGIKSNAAPQKWRTAARQLVAEIGSAVFLDAAARWLVLGPSPTRPGVQLSSGEAEYEKGFAWFLAGQSDDRLPGLLANFAEGALKKIPMLGAVSQKVGNACVLVLAELPGMEPVSQLSRLGQRVRYDTAQRLIEEALASAAQKAGVTREQLEEMTVPDCGLDAGGTRTERFGDYHARLAIEDTTSATVSWSDANGKPLKSVPAGVKETHSAEWKELQRSVKDTEKMLSAHRTRIERLLLSQRAIPIDTFRSCYLDHPLLSDMSRRLIWQFDSGLGIWHDGRVIGDTGAEIDLAAQQTARLWHPVLSSVETILHWRCWLEDQQIRQPFKQAHREVYLITDAERETRLYSNRFAGHILRQHPFAALCEQRGWTYRLMGPWDSHNNPTFELPQFGLRIQYEVDFPLNETETSGHGIFLVIRTGATRFLSTDLVPQLLESIPPVVFSEVMRDLDLYAGVASIGADPAWGLSVTAPFREHWVASTFGELTEMARNRAGILERLLPQLAIGDRCRVNGRYLEVRGERATYYIHLGSGNVKTEPGSRYLCIVEGAATRTTPRDVFVPFEGDHLFSVILSKAIMLANDRKIKDETILRQLIAIEKS